MRVCEFCGCSEPVVDVKRDPEELRRELEERRDEIDRRLEELELEKVEA